jgi:hypothetical protein
MLLPLDREEGLEGGRLPPLMAAAALVQRRLSRIIFSCVMSRMV